MLSFLNWIPSKGMWCGLLPISHTGTTWAQSNSAISPQCGSPPSATFWMLFGLLFDFLHYTIHHFFTQAIIYTTDCIDYTHQFKFFPCFLNLK